MSEPEVEVVVFVEEPPTSTRQGRRYNWEAIADQLRDRPGQWALVMRQQRRTLATAIRRGRIGALQDTDGTFEVSTRNQHNNLADLYMRFVPTEEDT